MTTLLQKDICNCPQSLEYREALEHVRDTISYTYTYAEELKYATRMRLIALDEYLFNALNHPEAE